MDHADKTILVTGATGRQGGAVARHLLADGWRVRALVRNPDADAAKALAATGVELVRGDLGDRASLDAAVSGAHGVYSMQNTRTAGLEGEFIQGANIADAAAAAGVRHFVYTSAEHGDPHNQQPYMLSKARIEQHIRDLALPATIWRPVTFMENYLGQREQILGGKLAWPLWPESMVYLIAVDDIGRFVALAFGDPERFIGTEMAIAGDELSMLEVAETFAFVLEREVEFVHVDELNGVPAPPRPSAEVPQYVRAHVEQCRELLPDLRTLAEWIEQSGFKPS